MAKVLNFKRDKVAHLIETPKPSGLPVAQSVETKKARPYIGDLAALQSQIPPMVMKRMSLAELLPTGAKVNPEWTDWDFETAVKEGYIGNVWSYVAIFRIVQSLGQPAWRLESKRGKEWEEVDDHPAARLLERPNPLEPRRSFIERCALHLFLGAKGNQAIVRKGGNRNGAPVELWNIRPDLIAAQASANGKSLAGYKIKTPEGVEIAPLEPPENIIPLCFVDPLRQLGAIAPVQAAGRDIDIDSEASEWQMASLQNRAVVSGILSFPYRLTQDQLDNARAMMAEQQGADNAQDIFVVGSDAKFTQMSLGPVEMDYVRSKKLQREAILAAYGVPPVVAGIFENATLANVDASWVAFWLNTIIPLLDLFRDYWQEFLIRPNWPDEQLRLVYDLSNIKALLPLFRENAVMVRNYWMAGVPMKELNRRFSLGFREFPGWERSYVQSKYIGLDEDGVPIRIEDPTALATQENASIEGQMDDQSTSDDTD